MTAKGLSTVFQKTIRAIHLKPPIPLREGGLGLNLLDRQNEVQKTG